MNLPTTIELKAFNVAGVKFRPADVIDPLITGQEIRLTCEPENPYDKFAIKVEAQYALDYNGDEGKRWELIGYVPKKDTWLFHLARKAGIKLSVALFVNHDARDEDKLLVRATFQGREDASFL